MAIPKIAKQFIIFGSLMGFGAMGLKLYYYYFGKDKSDKEVIYQTTSQLKKKR